MSSVFNCGRKDARAPLIKEGVSRRPFLCSPSFWPAPCISSPDKGPRSHTRCHRRRLTGSSPLSFLAGEVQTGEGVSYYMSGAADAGHKSERRHVLSAFRFVAGASID